MFDQSRSREMPPPRYLSTVEGGEWGRSTIEWCATPGEEEREKIRSWRGAPSGEREE